MLVTFAADRRGRVHGLHPRAGHGRASRWASASTRWACAATTCASSTTTASASRPRTCSASPARASRSPCTILNNGRLSLGTGSVGRREVPARPDDRAREGAPPVRPAAGRLRAGPGQDRLDGLLPVRARVDGLPHHRPGRPGRAGLLARVGDLQGRRAPSSSGTRPTARSSSPAAPGYMRDQPYEKYLRDIRIFPIFEGANDVMRAFIALAGHEAARRRAEGDGRRVARPTRSARSACWPTTWPGASRARCSPTGSRGRTTSSTTSPAPVSEQVKRLRSVTEGLLREHRGGIARAPVPPEAAGVGGLRHLRADRGALARDGPPRRARASSRRARSATSPRPSAAGRPPGSTRPRPGRAKRRRAHGRHRQARLQAR